MKWVMGKNESAETKGIMILCENKDKGGERHNSNREDN